MLWEFGIGNQRAIHHHKKKKKETNSPLLVCLRFPSLSLSSPLGAPSQLAVATNQPALSRLPKSTHPLNPFPISQAKIPHPKFTTTKKNPMMTVLDKNPSSHENSVKPNKDNYCRLASSSSSGWSNRKLAASSSFLSQAK